MSVYNEPTVYKSGAGKPEIIEITEFPFTILEKYQSKLGSFIQNLKYSQSQKIFFFGTSFNVLSSFTPSYDPSDIVGEPDWPALGYFEISDYAKKDLNTPIIFKESNSTSVKNGVIQIRKFDNKIAFCVNTNLSSNWHNVCSAMCFFE